MKNKIINGLVPFLCLGIVSCTERSTEQVHNTIAETVDGTPIMESWFLSTGDWKMDPQIYVREFGTGPDTVLLLHGGWGAEHSGMVDMVRELGKEYKFFAHEQRGSLRSPFPDSLITYEHHIEDVELLRRELGIEKLILLGHSMGAVLASAYAQRYPEHVEKLVLVSPAYLKNPFPEEDIELLQTSQKTFEKFRQRPEVKQELQKHNLIRKDSSLSSKEKTIVNRIGFATRMLHDVGNWYKLNNGKALYKGNVYGLTENTYPENGWDFIEEFKNQSYPISIIIGDHDFLDMGNHITRKWSEEIPNAEFTSIEKAGHLPWIDKPHKLAVALRTSL
ncbi:alpha/beta fold hydrolase [Flagellimonas allohymeniacidonis]|uniref:Alpha/beta hydrolase n=1 Tax=Flagellimonas allohymeniacidonis TaxID=2517819 RepID=A0A4Q8QJH6_9FLAO|nr:alpha/beta hydrolase [Allomuricauda hymeniacidonis]TAI48386.1 alpha/beta hydrolase [Allomuricauda hymeniacidonis]